MSQFRQHLAQIYRADKIQFTLYLLNQHFTMMTENLFKRSLIFIKKVLESYGKVFEVQLINFIGFQSFFKLRIHLIIILIAYLYKCLKGFRELIKRHRFCFFFKNVNQFMKRFLFYNSIFCWAQIDLDIIILDVCHDLMRILFSYPIFILNGLIHCSDQLVKAFKEIIQIFIVRVLQVKLPDRYQPS